MLVILKFRYFYSGSIQAGILIILSMLFWYKMKQIFRVFNKCQLL